MQSGLGDILKVLLGFIVLLSSSGPAIAVDLALPGGQFTSNAGQCKHLFVDPMGMARIGLDLYGLDLATTPSTSTADSPRSLLKVSAVLYVPRPPGTTSCTGSDLYTVKYRNLHLRDLWILRNVLRANSIRLGSWNPKNDHSDFLELCRKHSLLVIPSFDFARHFTTKARLSPLAERQDQVFRDFTYFFQRAIADTKGKEDLILMWSINHGLSLAKPGLFESKPLRMSDLLEREEYWQLLKVIRKAHWIEECVTENSVCPNGLFKRPLAVTLLLDTKRQADSVGSFIAYAESEWGTWPTDDSELGIDKIQFNKLRKQGAFDAWILQAAPTTSGEAKLELFADLQQANATPSTTPSGKQWRDVETQSLDNPVGDHLPNCSAAGGCTYTTKKLVLAQYGFASQAVELMSMKVNGDPGPQQRFLREVWATLSSDKTTTCAHAGAIIDEFMDDWDRAEVMGCGGSPYTHGDRDACDIVQPGRPVHYNWFGLNGQFSVLGLHCLDPRYLPSHDTAALCGGKLTGEVGNCSFGFGSSLNAEWPAGHKELMLCATVAQSWNVILLSAAILLLGLLRECQVKQKVIPLLSVVQQSVRPSRTVSKAPPDRATPLMSRLEESQAADILNSTDLGMLRSRSKSEVSRQLDEQCLEAEIDVPLPMDFCELDVGREFSLTVRAKAISGEATFTRKSLRAHAWAHVRVQSRRLQQQIDAEVLALRDEQIGRSSDMATLPVATENIHARVMEGYLAWLDNKKDAASQQQLQALLCHTPAKKTWMLFVEALLLRTVESLAEHVLHAPELIALLYHNVRWSEGNDLPNALLPDKPFFHIDLSVLHAGIEAMCLNLDPLKGGVNFDDLNDHGEAEIEGFGTASELGKTYFESISLQVVLDLLTDFGPVITVKMWLFYLAWYIHGGDATGNSGACGTLIVPMGPRADALQIFTMIDCVVLFVTETLLLFHGLGQRRLCWRRAKPGSRLRQGHGQWIQRRLLYLSFSMAGLLGNVLLGKVGGDLCMWREESTHWDCPDYSNVGDPMARTLQWCLGYAVLRVLSIIIGTRPRRIPFVSSAAKGTLQHVSQAAQSSSSFQTWVMPMGRGEYGLADQSGDHGTLDLSTWWVWPTVLVLTIAFESMIAVPIVAGFTFSSFCGDVCTGQVMPAITVRGHTIHAVSSECTACSLALVVSYLMMIITCFMDLHFIFYLVVCIGGYAMGEQRGLRNVLALALRTIDLDSGLHQQHVNEEELWTTLTDGRAMECVFGSAWRKVWSCAVESLFEDCKISDTEATQLVQAARTIRFCDKERLTNELANPGQRYVKVRFKATKLRGGGWRKAGRACCISKLHVKHTSFRSFVEFPTDEDSFHKVLITSAQDCEKLMECLDDQLIARSAVPAFGLEKGWQLTHVENGKDSALWSMTSMTLTDLAEDMASMRSVSNFPADFVFVKPNSFGTAVVDFGRPNHVQAISFSTSEEEVAFDPVRWEVDGLTESGTWLRIQTQDVDFATPQERCCPAGAAFVIEPWRVNGNHGSTMVDLRTLPAPVAERLCFFASSLRVLLKGNEVQVKPGRDSLMDCQLGRIPTLTQLIPCYSEQVLFNEESLSTNLRFIISRDESEWINFARRQQFSPRELYHVFTRATLRDWAHQAEVAGDAQRAQRIRDLILEVRFWASLRGQTIARTVAGAVQYHKVLGLLPSVQQASDRAKALEGLVQLHITHQTYGKPGCGETDSDMRQLLLRYKDYPIFMVCDFDNRQVQEDLRDAVTRFVLREFRCASVPRYASVLMRINKDYKAGDPENTILEVVEVMPRCYPLVLKEVGAKNSTVKTQGKAGNQLSALRFSPGHYIQLMDANMGAFFGEACKVPCVLRSFQPPGTDRKCVQARIIGFREHIFTERHGAVGAALAQAEWTFGTIIQRFLSGLGARMHYGHPDFFDGFWASNRGSVSKASPTINLSEDIFAGFNVMMRGERVRHFDCIEWEKGRETSFNKAAQFYTKVASGNVGIMRSRDLKILTESLSISDNFSFYFASVGFYLFTLATDISLFLYMLLFILLTLSSRSLHQVGSLQSMLATEWTLSFGLLSTFPRLAELILEFGILEGLSRFIPSMPTSVVLFSFLSRSMAAAVGTTMRRGEASYSATGRPLANSHYGWRECYFLYRKTHYYPALRIFFCYATYRLLSRSYGVSALPMMVLLLTAATWIVAPIIFCPEPTLQTIKDDLSEFWAFCIASSQRACERYPQTSSAINLEERLAGAQNNEKAHLYDLWLGDRLQHKKTPIASRLLELLGCMVVMVLMLAVVMATMVDQMSLVFILVAANFFLVTLWRTFNLPTVLLLLSLLAWCAYVPVLWDYYVTDVQFGPLLVAFALVHQALQVFERSIMLLVWLILRPDPDCASMPETNDSEREAKAAAILSVNRYDRAVEYLYVNLMTYQLHLYFAMILLVVNLVVQLMMVGFEMLGGFHSWWLLNGDVRSRPGGGYEPPVEDEDSQGNSLFSLFGSQREGVEVMSAASA